ncbi:MAG: hypothetical protein ACM3U0_01265 [archaeon]
MEILNGFPEKQKRMARKIKIDNSVKQKIAKAGEINKITTVPAEKYLDVLNNRYPNKLNFTISETAEIISLSYDFVREKILQGLITAVKFGDRFMVSQFELSRLLAEGVK